MDSSTLSLIDCRLAVLETVFIGDHSKLPSQDYHLSLHQRFEQVRQRLDVAEKDLPDLAVCRNLVDAIAPILTMKRSTLPAVVEKSKELLANREALVEHVAYLQAIHSHDLPDFTQDTDVIAEARQRLDKLDKVLQQIAAEAMTQAREIDSLLQIYEEAMLFLRETSLAWHARLARRTVTTAADPL